MIPSLKNQKILYISLVVLAIVLIILVIIDIFRKKAPESSLPNENNQAVVEEGIAEETIADKVMMAGRPAGDAFREEVSTSIVVPELDTKLSEEQKKEIAIPQIVVPAAPGAETKFRSFTIMAENDVYSPSKIIARVGDTVSISFTAVDKDYDIIFPSYNMKQSAKAGQTKMLQFSARKEGDFTYYCSLCGGPEEGPKGNIIIVAE